MANQIFNQIGKFENVDSHLVLSMFEEYHNKIIWVRQWILLECNKNTQLKMMT